MTKRDLVVKIAKETDLVQNDVAEIVQKTLDNIAGELIAGRSIELRNFGVFEIKAFLSAEMTRDQVIDHACRMTRNYAKRQMTWFKHRFAPDYIINDAKSPDILTKALHFLE